MRPTTIAVTGASGFIGSSLVKRLSGTEANVFPLTRLNSPSLTDFDTEAWATSLHGVGTVVHLAAAVQGRQSAKASETDQQQLNVNAPTQLLKALAQAGGRRFVFLSTVAVHGTHGASGQALSADSPLAPATTYGAQKALAERFLLQAAKQHDIELVIIRPTSVYGPGSNGPLERLGAAVAAGRPMPLPSTSHRRQFIDIESLLDMIVALAPAGAPAGTYMAADATGLSTREIIEIFTAKTGRPARSITIPAPAWDLLKKLPAIGGLFASLGDPLIIDTSAQPQLRGWAQRTDTADALKRSSQPSVAHA